MSGGNPRDEIERLERENALLREELWEQWEANHFEHCDREWPHAEGVHCSWPLPDVLGLGPR